MTVLQFPKQKPNPGQFELPRAKVCEIVYDLCADLMASQSDLMAAKTAEEFSAAIVEVHRKVTEASAGFSQLVDVTRHWRR
jgi:hypothetical protein